VCDTESVHVSVVAPEVDGGALSVAVAADDREAEPVASTDEDPAPDTVSDALDESDGAVEPDVETVCVPDMLGECETVCDPGIVGGGVPECELVGVCVTVNDAATETVSVPDMLMVPFAVELGVPNADWDADDEADSGKEAIAESDGAPEGVVDTDGLDDSRGEREEVGEAVSVCVIETVLDALGEPDGDGLANDERDSRDEEDGVRETDTDPDGECEAREEGEVRPEALELAVVLTGDVDTVGVCVRFALIEIVPSAETVRVTVLVGDRLHEMDSVGSELGGGVLDASVENERLSEGESEGEPEGDGDTDVEFVDAEVTLAEELDETLAEGEADCERDTAPETDALDEYELERDPAGERVTLMEPVVLRLRGGDTLDVVVRDDERDVVGDGDVDLVTDVFDDRDDVVVDVSVTESVVECVVVRDDDDDLVKVPVADVQRLGDADADTLPVVDSAGVEVDDVDTLVDTVIEFDENADADGELETETHTDSDGEIEDDALVLGLPELLAVRDGEAVAEGQTVVVREMMLDAVCVGVVVIEMVRGGVRDDVPDADIDLDVTPEGLERREPDEDAVTLRENDGDVESDGAAVPDGETDPLNETASDADTADADGRDAGDHVSDEKSDCDAIDETERLMLGDTDAVGLLLLVRLRDGDAVGDGDVDTLRLRDGDTVDVTHTVFVVLAVYVDDDTPDADLGDTEVVRDANALGELRDGVERADWDADRDGDDDCDGECVCDPEGLLEGEVAGLGETLGEADELRDA
jgi:hypothetical protein